MLTIRMEKNPVYLLLYPQARVVTSIPYLHHHKNSHSPITQFLNMIFILSLAFSYTIHTSLHQYVLKYSSATIEIEVPSS